MEPPMIRVHKFEHTVAIKWPDHDRWWVIDPDAPGGAGYAAASATFDGPDAREWVDPVTGLRPPTGAWAESIRRDLASIEQVLRGMDTYHPLGG
jgi:hypothetical protein